MATQHKNPQNITKLFVERNKNERILYKKHSTCIEWQHNNKNLLCQNKDHNASSSLFCGNLFFTNGL